MNNTETNGNDRETDKKEIQLPRYIFAIGGAGKSLIYTVFNKDWILEEILKPRHVPVACDITIIDTAVEEEGDDKRQIEKIKTKIKKIETKNQETAGSAGIINITYMLLTKDMVLQSPYDLIGTKTSDEIKKATNAPIWWLNEAELSEEWNEVMTKENLKEMSFAKGVYRKRAIAKAIYYKALSQRKFDIGLITTAKIDIIIGLGGGTGSGMAYDLATKLKSIRPTADITLFGILSTLHEDSDEKANSFAMLGELEYGRIKGDNLFNHIILVPMEMTQFTGWNRHDATNLRLLSEFDETFPYILMAYHNNHSQQIFRELPVYAPFIIVSSQMVRYNIQAIKKLKDDVDKSLTDKELSLKSEKPVYEAIEKFVNEYYKERITILPNQLSNEDKQYLIDDRFSKFLMVANHEFFKSLEYNSVTYMAKDIKTGMQSAGEEIEKQISSIMSEIDANVTSKTYRDDTDTQLYQVLKSDIEMIDTVIKTLNLINKIPDKLIVDTLKSVVKIDEDNLGRMLNKIREKIDSLKTERSSLDKSIKSLNDEMKNYDEKIRNNVETQLQKWKQNETKNIESLDTIDNSTMLLQNDFMMLKDELNDYVVSIIKETTPKLIDTKSTKNIDAIVDKIYQDLEKIGIYYQDKSMITKSIDSLKELRKAQIESKRKPRLFDRILNTDRANKPRQAKNKTLLKVAELNEFGVYSSKDSKDYIICTYQYDVVKNITNKKEEIISAMLKRAKNEFPDAVPPLFSVLTSTLESTERRKGASEDIKTILLSHLGYEIDINRIEKELKDKSAILVDTTRTMNIFQSLDIIITRNTKEDLGKHATHLKRYHDAIESIKKGVQAMHNAEEGDVRYIMEIQPENIYKATARDSNINNILTDVKEKNKIRTLMKGAVDRTMNTKYNMLVQHVIESRDNKKRWENTKTINTVVTIADTIDTLFIDKRTDIVNTFSNAANYEDVVRFGEPWEVGTVLFIAGVPLDNIKSITDSGVGYYNSYMEMAMAKKEFFHHSYKLEEGILIKRKKIFNFMTDSDKMLLLESNNSEIKQAFLDNYEEVNIKKTSS